jgi:hypothetical protein
VAQADKVEIKATADLEEAEQERAREAEGVTVGNFEEAVELAEQAVIMQG